MLDTIEFRLYDLQEHEDIYKALADPKYARYTKKRRAIPFEDLQNRSATYERNIMLYGDTQREEMEALRGDLYIPSSHYFLYFAINNTKDYIHFNFSIPKYLWGNNIAQFVRSVRHKDFMLGRDYKFTEQMKYLYARLVGFMKRFFEENFPEGRVNWTKVEVTRLDFCYNQLFRDKGEAMRFLEHQKKLDKKNSRIEGARYMNYDTSIMYAGKEMSLKVYHKGTEFAKHDLRELHLRNLAMAKANGKSGNDLSKFQNLFESGGYLNKDQKREYMEILRNGGSNGLYFDTDFLQALADRTLRYEMTFRKVKMSKLYREYVFRKKDHQYQREMLRFQKWWNETKSGENLSLLQSSLPRQEAIRTFKYILRWKRLVLSPRFKISETTQKDNRKNGIRGLNQIWEFQLDEEVIKEMAKLFRGFVLEFQPKAIDDETTFKAKIRRMNESARANNAEYEKFMAIDPSMDDKEKAEAKERYKSAAEYIGLKKQRIRSITKMDAIYQLFLKYGSWDAIKRSGDLPKATLYRWKKDFEELGMDKTHMVAETFNVETNFEEYLMIESINYNKLKPNFL